MGSKREEERNEKIIRGLMKLPPNRRCINCNSLGPQYVCTTFWTFICMPCSGIHREFTHRVKSVSMAKFTSQEVDALQKGGNQRARELFLMGWDPQRQRLPDNSNPEKVREFIKNVYVDKRYAVEKSSERPPTDPQSIRSHEDEVRRASSYHSYSQSPPYDFQYEERRYGKPVPSLTRKPGSDHILCEGKFSSFSSPSRFSDHTNDEGFANEGSFPGASDYSASSGGDLFRSDVLSSSSQRETWSPFSETSSNFSSEIHGHHTVLHKSDANGGSNAGRIRHPQRTASSGSFGSFDSMSFRSENSMGLQELAAEAKQSIETSHDKTSSFHSLPQSSTSTTFNGLDLFNEPFAPQNFTSTPTTVSNSQSPELLLTQYIDLFQQSPISSVPTQPRPEISPLPPPQNFTLPSEPQSVASSNGKSSDVAMSLNGGWATFDVSQNLLPMGSENSVPVALSSSDGNNLGDLNPFSLDQSSFSQKFASHEPAVSKHALWHDGLQNVETTISNTQLWSAFEDSCGKQPIEKVPKDRDRAAVLGASNANRSLGIGVYEDLRNDENFGAPYEIEPPSSLSPHLGMVLHDFSVVPEVAGLHSVASVHKPNNPFDLPCDAALASSNMTQYWDMSSLQATLPNNQTPSTYVGDANESWFPRNSVTSYIPGGVTFDPPNAGSLGFIAGQAPSAQISRVPAQGGNPFA